MKRQKIKLGTPEAEQALIRASWETGCLRYILKPDLQRRVYDFTWSWKEKHPNSAKPLVWDLHRAAGKTFELALVGIECCVRKPGQEVRFAAATVTQADEIVEPNVRKILAQMPEGFHANRRVDKGCPYYEIFNPSWPSGSFPSRFWIIGCRERADSHRGKRSNVILIDECRDIDNFEYIAKVVFGPHFATMTDPLYIMSSTPPESMDHAFSRIFCNQAQEDNRYICGPVTEDKDWTADDDERMLELFRSKDSPEWKREMLCQHISDPARLIVPEFNEALHVVQEYERPEYFIPLVVADGGYVDYFACLYGYVDFLKQKLVVEDCVIANKLNSGQIAESIQSKREQLYGTPVVDSAGTVRIEYKVNPRQHADMRPRELADLEQIYKLSFVAADTHDIDAQIATLRDYFSKNKIVILSNNEGLIRQLKNAIRDEKGKITRSEEWGHWDAVVALVYMSHVAPWNTNPIPKDDSFDWTTKQYVRGGRPRSAISGARRGNLQMWLRKRFRNG